MCVRSILTKFQSRPDSATLLRFRMVSHCVRCEHFRLDCSAPATIGRGWGVNPKHMCCALFLIWGFSLLILNVVRLSDAVAFSISIFPFPFSDTMDAGCCCCRTMATQRSKREIHSFQFSLRAKLLIFFFLLFFDVASAPARWLYPINWIIHTHTPNQSLSSLNSTRLYEAEIINSINERVGAYSPPTQNVYRSVYQSIPLDRVRIYGLGVTALSCKRHQVERPIPEVTIAFAPFQLAIVRPISPDSIKWQNLLGISFDSIALQHSTKITKLTFSRSI